MKRLMIVAAIAVSVALPATASAAERGNPGPSDDFTVIGREHDGHRVGDNSFAFKQTLYQHGKQVGHSRIKCTFTRRSGICHGRFKFADGVIAVRGPIHQGHHQQLNITCGKGAYKHADGKFLETDRSRKVSKETFKFS